MSVDVIGDAIKAPAKQLDRVCIRCIFACCIVRLIVDQFINMLSIFLNIVVIILMSVL